MQVHAAKSGQQVLGTVPLATARIICDSCGTALDGEAEA